MVHSWVAAVVSRLIEKTWVLVFGENELDDIDLQKGNATGANYGRKCGRHEALQVANKCREGKRKTHSTRID